ncbi:MAG: hypothetical protein ACK5AZ_18685 [Bryobacteraceae bacterium]
MRITVNLASEPFRRDRPMLLGSYAVAVVMVLVLAMLVALTVAESGELAETRESIRRAEEQLATIAKEQAKVDEVLRLPRNAEVLERSLFLNALLVRKGISWVKIFDDLESVLPYNVRLINVRLNPQNETLDMLVGAETSEAVLDLLKQMEGSPLFGATSVHSWLPPSQTDPLYRYRISVRYVQKL